MTPPATTLPVEAPQAFLGVARSLTDTFRDPWKGLEWATVAMLQSPHFLFRVEIGEASPEHPDWLRFTDY